MPRTIADIDAEIEKLRARKAHLVARETVQQRRLRTRQAAILGGWLMTNEPETVQRIKTALKRPQDRAAFSLDLPTNAGSEPADPREGQEGSKEGAAKMGEPEVHPTGGPHNHY